MIMRNSFWNFTHQNPVVCTVPMEGDWMEVCSSKSKETLCWGMLPKEKGQSGHIHSYTSCVLHKAGVEGEVKPVYILLISPPKEVQVSLAQTWIYLPFSYRYTAAGTFFWLSLRWLFSGNGLRSSFQYCSPAFLDGSRDGAVYKAQIPEVRWILNS